MTLVRHCCFVLAFAGHYTGLNTGARPDGSEK